MAGIDSRLVVLARRLSTQAARLHFKAPVTHVYNPLSYARKPHEEYLRRFANSRKRIVFLGMNPGPFGMVQTGIPFGEIKAVRDWMGIRVSINKPTGEHPKRPILGLECPRSEVSGRRLWGLFAERFGSPEEFFAEQFVANYCPLAFLEKSGLNRTPNKIPPAQKDPLLKICDEHLRGLLEVLEPEWLIGVGGFATERARIVSDSTRIRVGQILHPSPASPAANRGWAKTATKQLIQLGVWK